MRFFLLFHRRNNINIEELEKLGKYYHEGKLAHAYLISTNNIDKCMKVLISVVKNIFCVQEYSENCNKCSLCHLIDLGNLPSLKIIEPDGTFIKKEQILELESSFSKSSQFTDVSIYIIKKCEKMNKESANTMLKFLEEPEGNIIGFFITNSINNILPTISSRCQHIEVNFENELYEKLNIEQEKYIELEDIVINYLQKIEIEKKANILYNKECLLDLEKEDLTNIFKIILDIYQNKLENKYLNNIKDDKFEFLNNLNENNLKKKVNLIIEVLNELLYNVNIDLLMDRFVLEMEVINNETL